MFDVLHTDCQLFPEGLSVMTQFTILMLCVMELSHSYLSAPRLTTPEAVKLISLMSLPRAEMVNFWQT